MRTTVHLHPHPTTCLGILPPFLQLEKRDPELHAAALQPTPAGLRTILIRRNLQRALPEAERQSRLAQVSAPL